MVTVDEVAGVAVVATDRIDAVLAHLPVPPYVRREVRGLPAWRAREYAAARALLAYALDRAGVAPAPVVARPGGGPGLLGRPGVGVSISHTDHTVAVAVAAGRDVGVDAQDAWEPGPALLRRCCDPPLARQLTGLAPAERGRRFARLWSAQEACVKAEGIGLRGRPWTIPVHPGSTRGRWHRLSWWQLRSPDAPVAVCCALSVPNQLEAP